MSVPNFQLNDGKKIPAIAYGTGSVWKWQDVVPYVEQALEVGFTHLDTAAFYQTEEGLGRGVKESGLPRTDLYITTKFGGRAPDITSEIQVSLKNLGVEYVDLYLIHTPAAVRNDFAGAWAKMEQVKEDGYAKSIGVSNFLVEDLQAIIKNARVIPAVNQIKVHPYNYGEIKPTIEYCKKRNIVVEAYSSLTPITTAPGGPVDGVLESIAKKSGATPAQVIQKWVLSKGIAVVTTSSKRERLKEYLAVPDLPSLTDEDIKAIEEAGAKGPPTNTNVASLAKRVHMNWRSTLVLTVLIVILFVVGNAIAKSRYVARKA